MRRAIFAGLMVLTVAGCGGNRTLHDMRTSTGGPDDFTVLPTRPLEIPQDVSVLPAPTPGGTNLTDPDPIGDTIAVLGGRSNAAGGIPAADAALINSAARYGVDPSIRSIVAAEDEAFRRRRGTVGRLSLTNRNRYFRAYAVQALDAVAEFLRFRNLGVQVPSAPPENR